MSHRSLGSALWGTAYLATMVVIVLLLFRARQWAIAELTKPREQDQWQHWRDDELRRDQTKQGPVRRRPPSSFEPPLLVLLRDNFAGVTVGVLVIASFLFGFTMVVIRGMRVAEPFDPSPPSADERPRV